MQRTSQDSDEEETDPGVEQQQPKAKPRWQDGLRAALVETASRVSGAMASAQELLRDKELRR